MTSINESKSEGLLRFACVDGANQASASVSLKRRLQTADLG